jgi:hypothetical protein
MARKLWTRGRWAALWRQWFDDEEDRGTPLPVDEHFTIGEAPSAAAPKRSGGSAKRDPALSIIKRIGLALKSGGGGSREYEPPEFNFQEITDAYNTEGYVRQAIDKYIDMIFKAGWDFVGRNPAAVEYVKLRFALMAEATQTPTDTLWREMCEDLVKYSNVIVAKARAKDALPFQGMNVMGIGENMPVAGYFPLNVNTMKILRDQYGTVKGWQQEVEGSGKPVKFKPQDIVHIPYKREKGYAFGTPFLLPGLDDIRALRQIEENVLRLVYRNLHPLWHIKVGLDKGPEFTADEFEVEKVRLEVENMDVEGGLVTNERVNILPIASNQIIDAKEYLKHFEERVFTVMGVSALMMGRGNTANRSTGDNISGEFIDRCKAFQRCLSTYINEFMLKEILMEGGFDPVLNPDDIVVFRFKEIDMDSQIKWENQAVFLYEHNAITEDEMRELLGRDPIEDGEMRSKMHLQVVTLTQAAAEAALKPAATGTSSAGAASTKKRAATDNKQKPTNQHGTKTSPKKTTNQAYVQYLREIYEKFENFRLSLLAILQEHYNGNEDVSDKIPNVGRYMHEHLMHVTSHYTSEQIAQELHLAFASMIETACEEVYAATMNFSGKEAYQRAREVSEGMFDILYYRIGELANEAYTRFEKEGVTADGD